MTFIIPTRGTQLFGAQKGPSLKEKRVRKGSEIKQRVVKVYFNGGWKPDYQHTVRANRECLRGIKSQREGGHLGQMLSAGLKHLVAYLWMLVLPKQPQVTGQEKDQLVLTISLV